MKAQALAGDPKIPSQNDVTFENIEHVFTFSNGESVSLDDYTYDEFFEKLQVFEYCFSNISLRDFLKLILTLFQGTFYDDYGYEIPIEYLADAFYEILDYQHPNLDFEFKDEVESDANSTGNATKFQFSLFLKILIIYLS